MLANAIRALKRVPPTALVDVVAACEFAWPAEACGLVIDGTVIRGASGNEPNVTDARSEFRLHPADALALERAARAGRDIVLWHSHTNPAAPEGMSDVDIRAAAPNGEPLHAELIHLVVDVRSGRATGTSAFAWDGVGYTRIG